MKRIFMTIALVFAVSPLLADAESGEGVFGVDLGFSWGHFYISPFPDALGANLGIHYEPPLTQELNLVVGARYNFLYWADKAGNKEETMIYHFPQAGIGIKYLFDVYNIIPYMGVGFTFNVNAYDPNDTYNINHNRGAGVRFAPGVYFDLGADIYTSDEFSVGFNLRYDWTFDYLYSESKVPNLFSFNMRLNFLTIN